MKLVFKFISIFFVAAIIFLSGCKKEDNSIPLWKTIPEIPTMPPADESGLAPVNDIKMYYAIFNNKGQEPVILIHGGLGSSDVWGFEVPLLEKKHKVVVVDCRGRGRSAMSEKPLSFELMTSDIVQLMNYLHIKKTSIVGESDGGIIGFLMAINYPDRINKLFAFGANFNLEGYKSENLDTTLAKRYMEKVKAKYSKLSPTPDFNELLKALGKMYSTEPNIPPEELKKIKVPTIIADGEYEQFIKREHTEKLAHLIPGAKLLIMNNVSHGGPVQDPVNFHKAVINFLDNK